MASKEMKEFTYEDVSQVRKLKSTHKLPTLTFIGFGSTTRRATWYAFVLFGAKLMLNDYVQWIVIDSKVYDVSRFANLHPGGTAVLLADSIGASLSI